jgi:hypothetical protein
MEHNIHDQLSELNKIRSNLCKEYETAKRKLEEEFKKQLATTEQKYVQLQKAARREDVLSSIGEATKPILLIEEGLFARELDEKDIAALDVESYGELVIHASSTHSVCKDDRDGDGYDCEYEIDWDRTYVFRYGDQAKLSLSECSDVDTSFVDTEIDKDGKNYVKRLKFTDVDGDNHGIYAYAMYRMNLLTYKKVVLPQKLDDSTKESA